MQSKNNGFTLVELSIVLVIIGLLIGGILIGQSLVDSAKRNNLISQVEQYHIAIRLFKDRYRFYPGDLPDAYSKLGPACGGNWIVTHVGSGQNGNGNGRIDWATSSPTTRETRVKMCHLSQSGLLANNESYVRAGSQSSNQFYVGESAASTAYDDDIGLILTGKDFVSDGVAGPRNFEYAIWVGKENIGGSVGPTPLTYAFDPVTTLAIDKKSDDGSPQTGDMRPVTSNSPNGCTTGNTYNIATGGNCALMFFDPLN